jgi:predicted NodU family carbamoyl transferase
MNSTLHFLSTWHQESGAKKFTQQFDTTNPRIRFVDHHLAHVISAYGCSDFDDTAVVVMDGRGVYVLRLRHERTCDWQLPGGEIA